MMPGPWGTACHALRAQRGWTRRKVAKLAKMTAATYGRIEKGGHTLTSQLQTLADVFGVPIEDVLIPQGMAPSRGNELETFIDRRIREGVREVLLQRVGHTATPDQAFNAAIDAAAIAAERAAGKIPIPPVADRPADAQSATKRKHRRVYRNR